MADKEAGAGMTLKKKMTRTEFRKRADDILMRLTLEVEPFWQDSEAKQAQRLKRAAADPLYFCRTYLPHYFSHLPAPFHHALVRLLEARPASEQVSALEDGEGKSARPRATQRVAPTETGKQQTANSVVVVPLALSRF